MAETHLDALRSSVGRLHTIATGIADADLTSQAYPSEWTIADVMSHLGSGAVITQRRLDDALASSDTPDDFATGVWDDWNRKDPAAQRDDALAADAALLDRLESTTPEEREAFATAMGPMTFGFDEFVGMRLNEHALHTWDIDVTTNPAASLPLDATALIVDNLDLIARYTAQPTGDPAQITIATTDPERTFTIDADPDSVTLSPATLGGAADLVLPAEAFVRLIYGRLDSDHTPTDAPGAQLDLLRRIYPGP